MSASTSVARMLRGIRPLVAASAAQQITQETRQCLALNPLLLQRNRTPSYSTDAHGWRLSASSAARANSTVSGKAFDGNEDDLMKNGLCSEVKSTTPSLGVFDNISANAEALMHKSQISSQRISKEDFGKMFSEGDEIKLKTPEGIPMEAFFTRMQAPCTAQPVCSSHMHALSRAQLQPVAVHPMGPPTSFTTSRGLLESIGKIEGRSCLAAASPIKRSGRSFICAPKIGEEDELIQEELVLRLQMSSEDAAKVVKSAKKSHPNAHLSLHNLRGWIEALANFGLSTAVISGGLQSWPILIACSASGRENANAESIRVLTAHGLSDYQIKCVLRKYPAVMVNHTPSSLNAKLLRLKELGFPPSEEKGLLEKDPSILKSSLRWDTVQWLVGEGYAPEVARRMIMGYPTLLKFSPETNLSKTLDYFIWLVGSREDARSILAKQPTLFGLRKSMVHAKLAFIVDKLDIDVVTMMKQNYASIACSMDRRIGPRTLLLRSLGGAESFKVYSYTWLHMTDEAFVQHSSFCTLWEGRPRDVLEGAADLKEGLELCKEQWVGEEKPGWEKLKGEFQEQWEESGVEGLPQLCRDK